MGGAAVDGRRRRLRDGEAGGRGHRSDVQVVGARGIAHHEVLDERGTDHGLAHGEGAAVGDVHPGHVAAVHLDVRRGRGRRSAAEQTNRTAHKEGNQPQMSTHAPIIGPPSRAGMSTVYSVRPGEYPARRRALGSLH